MLKRLLGMVLLLTFGLAAGAAAGALVERHQKAEALETAFDRLRLFHDLRRAALEDYLVSTASDVRAASENPQVIEAMEKIDFAWQSYGPDARRTLPRLYIDENPAPQNQKYRLQDAGDGSYYSRYHSAFHVWARRFLEHFGYHNVFLINPRGDIVYTVTKENDFASSLKTGPYRTSPLADVFRRAIRNPTAAVDFSDFASYAASGAPAAFAGNAIFKDGKPIGVFAVQIPPAPLNDLMHFSAGMGESGETYLVGGDGMMRSQSRFASEPTLLLTKVDNASTQAAMEGKSGAHIVENYRGIPVLSVYAPVNFGGEQWVLLAETDRGEVLRDRDRRLPLAASVLAGLLAMGLGALIWRFARPATRRARQD